MGNKVNSMSICARKDIRKPQQLEDFSSFVSCEGNTSVCSTARLSIFDNPENVCLDDFNLLKVLGVGAFGKVFLVEKKTKLPGKKNKLYAMKVLRKEFILEKQQYEHTMTERRVLEELQSPFIV